MKLALVEVQDLNSEFTEMIVVPLLSALLFDPTASTRSVAQLQVGMVAKHLIGPSRQSFLTTLLNYSEDSTFTVRMIFPSILANLLTQLPISELPSFEQKCILLSKDPVPNVRVAVIQAIQEMIKDGQQYSWINSIMETAKQDKNIEVCLLAGGKPSAYVPLKRK